MLRNASREREITKAFCFMTQEAVETLRLTLERDDAEQAANRRVAMLREENVINLEDERRKVSDGRTSSDVTLT